MFALAVKIHFETALLGVVEVRAGGGIREVENRRGEPDAEGEIGGAGDEVVQGLVLIS